MTGFVFVGEFMGEHIAGVAGTLRSEPTKALTAVLYMERCIRAPKFGHPV